MKLTRTQIINTFIKNNNYTSYLEIGVNTPAQPGYSHTSIDIQTKHGVDPNVDTTFKMTSDDFFQNHIQQKYDIVFVDGLHIFEQAYRDIMNSLEHLNEGGMIVVHDCNPTREITQRRERASSIWHGDVWKAILKLRLENPNISIYTINADEGCSIITKGSQELMRTQKTEYEMYSFDFFKQNKKEILNLISANDFRKKMGIKINLFQKIFNF